MPLDYVYQHLTEPSNAGCFVSLQCVPPVKRAVSPETVIIPIVSCIIGFPILALLVICCLRRRAKLARDRDRRRNIDLQDHAVSLVRINAIHRFNYNAPRAVSLCSERSISHSIPSLELDTILEETFCSVEV
uniref:Uncharacterized protein n=1 Tax=Anopheles quadriannulatus TaxID=34691 RepID=A0A182WRK1_ANOQN